MSRLACCLTLSAPCLAAGDLKPSEAETAAPARSPAQLAWEAQLGPSEKKDPAYAFVKDDPALPRVLLIGDSISVGYTPVVREALKGKANVHRIPENGGDTWRGLAKLNAWLSTGTWDVIHFNFGLHDLKHMKDNKLDLAGEQISTLEAYSVNLDKLVVELKKTGAALVWATTTPVPEGANGRLKGDEVLYNAAALRVMAAHGVTVNDLYAEVFPVLEQNQRPRDVHYTPDGYRFLGRKVAAEILKAL
jgi:acyl-CoA thioesterase-1